MELEEALELLLDGHAVLFAGAGLSRGAINSLGESFKTSEELAVHLASKAGLPELTPLDDAAEEYLHLYGEGSLVNELKQEFSALSITSAHKELARVPWRRIYTTNYDNVLEKAFLEVEQDLKSVTLNDAARLRTDGTSDLLCVHLNGFVETLNEDSIGSELKLTDTSYLTAELSASPWATKFRQDLSLARAVFFVGYSLGDLDIRRLLYEDPALVNKCFFILGKQPDELVIRRVSRFGTALSIDTNDFAESIRTKLESYTPQDFVAHIGYSIEKCEISDGQPAFSDQSIFDLLMWGTGRLDFTWNALHGGDRYYLERQTIERVLKSIHAGSRAVVIHSELGNGKTLVLEGLKCRAIEEGFDVYCISRRSEDIYRELDLILNSDEKALLIIDNYPDWIDVIERFSLNAKPSQHIVLTARNAVHDVMVDRVVGALGVESLPEVSADLLTSDDLDWIISLFDEYGLWGENAVWSKRRKKRFLVEDCGSQFSSILIRVFESPQIARRFDRILQGLNAKRDYYKVLLSVMVMPVIQHPATTDLMLDIWGSVVSETQFRRNPAVREFFDFQAGGIKLRSSAAAQFILQRVADGNLTIDTLITMAKAFDRGGRYSETHRTLLRSLMRFSTLQNFLPERQRRPAAIRYYEGIKNLYGCQRNSQFWLQYAIACLTLGDLDRAERYFSTAYSYASSWNDATFQIDNHFARFLLVRSIQIGDTDVCMTSFRQARNIVQSQIRDDRLHYPYRVARSFHDFYEAFESELDSSHLDEIVRAAGYILRRIEALPESRRKHKNVVECNAAMQRIIDRRKHQVSQVNGE